MAAKRKKKTAAVDPYVREAIGQAAHTAIQRLPRDTPDRVREIVRWARKGEAHRAELAMSGAGPEDAIYDLNPQIGRDLSTPMDPAERAIYWSALVLAGEMWLASYWEAPRRNPRAPKGAPTTLNMGVFDEELRNGAGVIAQVPPTSLPSLRRLLDAGYLAPAPGRPKGHWVPSELGAQALEVYRAGKRPAAPVARPAPAAPQWTGMEREVAKITGVKSQKEASEILLEMTEESFRRPPRISDMTAKEFASLARRVYMARAPRAAAPVAAAPALPPSSIVAAPAARAPALFQVGEEAGAARVLLVGEWVIPEGAPVRVLEVFSEWWGYGYRVEDVRRPGSSTVVSEGNLSKTIRRWPTPANANAAKPRAAKAAKASQGDLFKKNPKKNPRPRKKTKAKARR